MISKNHGKIPSLSKILRVLGVLSKMMMTQISCPNSSKIGLFQAKWRPSMSRYPKTTFSCQKTQFKGIL